MNESIPLVAVAAALTTAGSLILYATSPNQAWRTRPLPAVTGIVAGILFLATGLALFVLAWGSTVGTLLGLATWMTVSVIVPYLAAWRGNA